MQKQALLLLLLIGSFSFSLFSLDRYAIEEKHRQFTMNPKLPKFKELPQCKVVEPNTQLLLQKSAKFYEDINKKTNATLINAYTIKPFSTKNFKPFAPKQPLLFSPNNTILFRFTVSDGEILCLYDTYLNTYLMGCSENIKNEPLIKSLAPHSNYKLLASLIKNPVNIIV